MLRAEQVALEQHGMSELLRILEREFNYYNECYKAVGTQSALIAGFAVTVLVTLDTSDEARSVNGIKPRKLPVWVTDMYHATTFVTLLTLLYTVVAVTAWWHPS